ncbi:hypothetical protein D3C78_1358250 [compost metagenome]
MDIITATSSATWKRVVTSTAIAPGAINSEIDRIIPTAFSVATMVSETMHSSP